MVEAIPAGEPTFGIEIATSGTVTLGILAMDHRPFVGIWIGTGAVGIVILIPGIHEWASAVVARVLLRPAISVI